MERSALVTGGASGLGRAAALALREKGYRVVVLDLRRGEENLIYAEGDVTREEDVRRAVARAQEEAPLFAVVNAAGIGLARKILGREGPHDLESFRRILEVNLLGTFNVLRLAAWAMRENPQDPEGQRGVIVNTASVAAFEGQVGQAAYAASKGGVVALTLPLPGSSPSGGSGWWPSPRAFLTPPSCRAFPGRPRRAWPPRYPSQGAWDARRSTPPWSFTSWRTPC